MSRHDGDKGVGAEWLVAASRAELGTVLFNYEYFVHRFVQWVGFTFAKCGTEVLRQLLLENLLEECGRLGGEPSHGEQLRRCISSCGIENVRGGTLAPSTISVENWFFSSFRYQDLHTCLCMLGPGTERVSSLFLKPLAVGVQRAFSDVGVDYTYFDLHESKVEDAHAEALDRAIRIIEEAAELTERARLERSRRFWTFETIAQHREFWCGLRAAALSEG